MKKRVAIVTGAAQGIGKAIAQQLLKDDYNVVLSDINEAVGQKTLKLLRGGKKAVFFPTDVGNEQNVKDLMAYTVKTFGAINLLVNNAALATPHTETICTLTLEDWNKYLRVNLTSIFLCAKYATPHLKKAKGVMINMSSTRSLMSEPNSEAYAACKGGAVAISHALAISLGPDVRVHCVSPGWIDTTDSKLRKIDHAQHPVGRVGVPQDVAHLVTFLASPEASFMTGNNVVIDGGMVRKMIYEV